MTELIEFNTLEDLPPKPIIPQTGFFIYKKEVFIQRRAEYPNLSAFEIVAKINQEYKDMKEKVQQKYNNAYQKQKDEYNRLIAEWREKYEGIERALKDKLKKAKKETLRIKKLLRKTKDIQRIVKSKQEIHQEETDSTNEANEIIRSITVTHYPINLFLGSCFIPEQALPQLKRDFQQSMLLLPLFYDFYPLKNQEEKALLNIRLEEALNKIKELQKMNDALIQENNNLKKLSQMNEKIDVEDSTGKE